MKYYCAITVPAFFSNVTTGVMAAFFFVSGYFLGHRRIVTRKDAGAFYLNRFIRIWPLFSAACLVFYLTGTIKSCRQLVLTLTGLSCIIPPTPLTLWFVAMLIPFYAVTPLILRSSKLRRAGVCLLLYLFLAFACGRYSSLDQRFLTYFPAYAAGLLLAEGNSVHALHGQSALKSLLLTGISLAAYIAAYLLREHFPAFRKSPASDYLTMVPLILVLLFAGQLIEKRSAAVTKFLGLISYGSMCAYLFHRPYYKLLYMNVFHGKWPVWFAYLFALPFILLISWGIQKLYDAILSRFYFSRHPSKSVPG
jgi:peptidoglycan/LPS O-acetylase OafA/YrhL